jgi:hypothetical protein
MIASVQARRAGARAVDSRRAFGLNRRCPIDWGKVVETNFRPGRFPFGRGFSLRRPF